MEGEASSRGKKSVSLRERTDCNARGRIIRMKIVEKRALRIGVLGEPRNSTFSIQEGRTIRISFRKKTPPFLRTRSIYRHSIRKGERSQLYVVRDDGLG